MAKLAATLKPEPSSGAASSGIVAKARFGEEPVSGAIAKLWSHEDGDDRENTDVTKSTAMSSRTAVRPRLTIMTGLRAGEVIGLDTDRVVLGRGKQVDVRIDDFGISRLHCRFVRSGGSFAIHDLGSTNGTLVNGVRVSVAVLQTGDRIQLGDNVVLQFALLDDVEDCLAQQLYEMSTRDPLTKAYNRRYFNERFDAELSYAVRHGAPLSLMVVDLDFFKRVNDTFGHGGGDELLRAVVKQISRTVRSEDLVARFGGEEFALILRSTNLTDAVRLGERIRQAVEALEVIWEGRTIRCTLSIGVAEASESSSKEDLLNRADKRLYQAKSLGRNCVVGPCDSMIVSACSSRPPSQH
jgi:diguanylate cyclase (GGDEF)-like protein